MAFPATPFTLNVIFPNINNYDKSSLPTVREKFIMDTAQIFKVFCSCSLIRGTISQN
ncbi:hypothetical protein BpPP18_17570 [Weizmannia acidilactici]|nr:hypothetical protein BpPP18_17570 [Weizmannia acidilactici]